MSYTPAELDEEVLDSGAAFSCEPHLRNGAAAVWYTSPPGVVAQLVEPARGTAALASWLVGPAYDELKRRFPRSKDLIFVFDLSLMQSRTYAARSVFLGMVRREGRRFREAFFVPPRHASAALKHSMRASLLLARAIGIKVELVDSVADAVRARNLRPLL